MSEKKMCIYKPRKDDEDYDGSKRVRFQISPGVQFKEVPTNGEEYLLKVKRERQNYSSLSVCTNDYSHLAINQTNLAEEFPYAIAPDEIKPTIEWQNTQVANFSDVRMYISRVSANKALWQSNLKKIELKDATISECWTSFFDAREPTLSCMFGLHHTLLDSGLVILGELLNEVQKGDTIDCKTGQWIYSFLAFTRLPLISGTAHTLRDIARKCAEIRSHLNPEDENVSVTAAPLNLFICIVARYFGQYDLED